MTYASCKADFAGAVEAWEKLVQHVPDRAYLAFERLERAYRALGAPRRFVDLCQRLIATRTRRTGGRGWRCRAISPPPASIGRRSICCSTRCRTTRTAWSFTSRCGRRWPRSASIPSLVRRYVDLTRNAVFYLDPHVCVRCRYRSTELLWQCPQCHEWNTFVEERIAPAKDAAVAELT